jgi:hypothetical protein
MAATMKKREGPKAPPTPDYQEERALARAVAAAQRFAPGTNAAVVSVAISEWIIARTSMAASVRLNADLMFDLKDARLRGFIEAALPAIGNTLSHLPGDKPLFDLSRDEVVGVFAAGIQGAQEAAVCANESLGFPFSDEVPF